MRHGSLFSGIGGFDLAAEWMGWTNVFHCEIAEFPRKILKHHFPNSICYEDIKKTDFTKHRNDIDIISGGFPCQPYSNAGKRRGKDDDRHLWPEMLRVIREVQPRFVVGENVSGLLTWNNGMVFHEIITDLENEGYETQAFLIPACATNAPHRRDRIWFVAYSAGNRTPQNGRSGANEEGRKTSIFSQDEGWQSKTIQSIGLCGLQRNATNSNNGSGLRNPIQTRWKEFEELYDASSNAANSDGTEQRNNIGENIGKEREIRWGKESDVFGKLRSDGYVAYTESQRTWEQSSEDRGREDRRFDNNGKEGNVADTSDKGLQRCKDNRGFAKIRTQRNQQLTRRISSRWQNFPTQSPVCGRDDGIPPKLDGITFSKWRNESIKGYGNAVVPQVVYQIFKAIEQCYYT